MTPSDDLQRLVERMPETARTCGDLLDDFPCVQCGADRPSKCPLPPSTVIPARDAINSTAGLGNLLRRNASALRARITQEQSNDPSSNG